MFISKGLKSGALLQRDDDGFCKCFFKAEANGNLNSTLGNIESIGGDNYILRGIPIGGPYNFEIFDNTERQSFTVWVGDLWILAGQSNMEGVGCVSETVDSEAIFDSVRCYRHSNCWENATPVTHEPWLSSDLCVGGLWRKQRRESLWGVEVPDMYDGKKVRKRAVGPGYYFAKKMFEITGVPQGVIPCALGGSSMEHWKKRTDTQDCLYSVMIRRFAECGGNVRGIYWDQGESETFSGSKFTEDMMEFVFNVRCDMNDKHLPFVQTQIAKTSVSAWCESPEIGIEWSRIKEEQRLLDQKIEFLTTVSAIDADFDDLIHYSAEFQKKMGTRAANAMANLIGLGGEAVPVPYKVTYRSDDEYSPFNYIYDIYYKNVSELTSAGTPSGFMIVPKSFDMKKIFNPSIGIQKIKLSENKVSLYTEIRDNPEDVAIYYGFGNMSYCNILTDTGFAIPAMGPVSPKDDM